MSNLRGVRHYISDSGFHTVALDYFADPEKDPDTPVGQIWLERTLKGIPGGKNSTLWQREYGRDWDVAGGDPVFTEFKEYRHKIVVSPFEVPETWLLFGAFDYGHRNPSAFEVFAIDFDRNVWTVWEYYKAGQGYRSIARAINACPYLSRLAYPPIADPSIFSENQNVEGSDQVKSIAQLFAEIEPTEDEKPIFFAKGIKGGDVTAAEKILGHLWKDLAKTEPRWKIFRSCPMMAWEIERLRYAEWSGTQQENRNQKEQIVDKDNHAFDCAKMFFNQFFWGPMMVAADPLAGLREVDPLAAREWEAIRKLSTKKTSSMGDF